jgi:hypothetical protein
MMEKAQDSTPAQFWLIIRGLLTNTPENYLSGLSFAERFEYSGLKHKRSTKV